MFASIIIIIPFNFFFRAFFVCFPFCFCVRARVPASRTGSAPWPAPLSRAWTGTAGSRISSPGRTAASRRRPCGPSCVCSASPVGRRGAGTRPASASLQRGEGERSVHTTIQRQHSLGTIITIIITTWRTKKALSKNEKN